MSRVRERAERINIHPGEILNEDFILPQQDYDIEKTRAVCLFLSGTAARMGRTPTKGTVMLLSPTDKHIYFAEYDVMKSAAASLTVAYSNRVRAAASDSERQWWENQRAALDRYVRGTVDTDRDDLVSRTRTMHAEFERIGGFTAVLAS